MRQAYPVVLMPGETMVLAHIPDFDIDTQGETTVEAMEMARDAIGLMGIDLEDDGGQIPCASEMADILRTMDNRERKFVTLVDVDFSEYRRKNDLHTVKKNCTIPSWLNYEAEKAGVNFSMILQSGLKAALGIKDYASLRERN